MDHKASRLIWFFGYAAAMLVNVVVPHVPLAFWFAGYTPGLITSVAVNLPCITFLLMRALGDQYVSWRNATVASAAVSTGLTVLILVLFLTSGRG